MPPERNSWDRVDLTAPEHAIEPEPPAYCGLIYRRLRHQWHGAPETAKTLLSWIVALEMIRDGVIVGHLDFETLAGGTRRLLTDLGATLDEMRAVYHVEPDRQPVRADIEALLAADVGFVMIDAAAGAYGVSGLDDGKRLDSEAFARGWIRPLFEAGVGTLVIDHVVKNREARGRFAIGSERKVGAADVAIGLEPITQLTRGGKGLIKLRVDKDRPGFLRRPYAAELHLRSDPDTHAITWALEETTGDADSGEWKPTVLMAKVSRYLQEQTNPVSKNTVETAITGQGKFIRQAITELIDAGHVDQTKGPRGSLLLRSIIPYPTSSDLVSTSSQTNSSDLVSSSSPFKGDEDEDELERLAALGHKLGVA